MIAAVVALATGRAVCLAFATALQRFGLPDEVPVAALARSRLDSNIEHPVKPALPNPVRFDLEPTEIAVSRRSEPRTRTEAPK